MAAPFIPRAVFPLLDSVPRSYYLGHHAAGLAKMRTMLSQIDLIIECRDYRVPLTSHNPLFEDALAGRERMVVYTKKDLGRKGNGSDKDNKVRRRKEPGTVAGRDGHERRLICSTFVARSTASQMAQPVESLVLRPTCFARHQESSGAYQSRKRHT
jgi:hypothetical protein